MSSDQQPSRLALVIGNANYKSAARLKNPLNDAKAIAAKLAELNFVVRTELDLDGEQFQRIVGEFCGELARVGSGNKSEVALLYFAGHGVQVRGENYLLPVDGDIKNEVDLKLRTVHLNVIMEAMGASAATSIVLLDCCRENPLPKLTSADGKTRSIGGDHGLAGIDAPSGAFVAFATQPDNVAEDGAGDNSPFTQALMENITVPDRPISELMIHVRRTVHQRTSGRQIPWDRSALFEPFAFRRSDPTAPIEARSPEELEKAREEEYWKLIKDSGSPEMLRSFALQFPNSPRKNEAFAIVDRLRRMRGRKEAAAWLTGAFSLVLLALVGAGILYISWLTRASDEDDTLDHADFVGGDLGLRPDSPAMSEFMCRVRCVLTRGCYAISYDTGARKCYEKGEVAYYIRTQTTPGSDDSWSEYVPSDSRPRPTEAPFRAYWNRTFIGEPVDASKVEQHPGLQRLKGLAIADKRTKKQLWPISDSDCQQACVFLGFECKGFSYTPFGKRCQLFRSITGIATEPDGAEVHTPTVVSGCTAKEGECPKGAD